MIRKVRNLSDFVARKKFPFQEGEMPVDDRMAYITHYIHNRNTAFESHYSRGIQNLNDLWSRPEDQAISETECDDFLAGLGASFAPAANPSFSFIDLFAGIGGFRLAMQAVGGKCVFSSESNPFAKRTYAYNFGEVPFGDITKDETKALIPPDFDVLCAGFPCQAFSMAGYKRGFDDTRGTLFFDVADIIRTHRPKVAFLENVRNLETHDGGKTFAVIRNTLAELGYKVRHKVLNAAAHGNIPQHRHRIIIVAFRNDIVPSRPLFHFPRPVKLTKTIHHCIEPGQKSEKYYYRENHKYYARLAEDMTNPDTIYQWRRIYCRDNKRHLCPTLTANMGSGGHNVPLILTGDGIRKLTPKECLNFMGYPSSFDYAPCIAESARYVQAGNSVVVPMMTRVAEQIARVIASPL